MNATLKKLKTNASHAHFNVSNSSSYNPCVTCPRGKAGMNGTCAQCDAVRAMHTAVLSLELFARAALRLHAHRDIVHMALRVLHTCRAQGRAPTANKASCNRCNSTAASEHGYACIKCELGKRPVQLGKFCKDCDGHREYCESVSSCPAMSIKFSLSECLTTSKSYITAVSAVLSVWCLSRAQ